MATRKAPEGMYTSPEVAAAFGISNKILCNMREENALLFTYRERSNDYIYDKTYVDGLAALWARYPAEISKTRDVPLFQLYRLHWDYYHADPNFTGRQLRVWRRQILARCEELEASGHLLGGVDAIATLTRQLPHNVQGWLRKESLVALRVGKYYITRRYAKYLGALFTEWSTIAQAADVTGLKIGTISAKVQRGHIYAVKGPDGLYHLPPRVVAGLVFEPDEPTMSVAEAAGVLGVSQASLHKAATRGVVRAIGSGKEKLVPRGEVQRWQQKFQQLNPTFSWLGPLVMAPGRPRTMSGKQAMKLLGLGPKAMTVWAKTGLVPYFLASFSVDCEVREYVQLYLFGLRRFAGTRKMRRSIAIAYRTLCQEKGQIV